MGRRRPSAKRDGVELSPPAALVLIADDDIASRELYALFLLSQGYRLQIAADGASAVARAIASGPDVIVMDLAMPHVDGWEATRQLKADPRTARIPIIACTAHSFGPAVERALIAGCDAYLVKPVLPNDLLRELRRVLANARARSGFPSSRGAG